MSSLSFFHSRSLRQVTVSAAAACFCFLAFSPDLLAQAGAGGGGTGGGAGAAGAGAAGAASGQGASGSAPGQGGGHGAGGNGAAATGQTNGTNGQTNAAQVYAASAAPGIDPRKPPPAKPGSLTLQQVVDRARSSNPTLLAAEANLRSVRAQELQAAVRANPYLGVAGSDVTEYGTSNGGPTTPYAYSLQVSRLFERGGKRGIRIENARDTTAQTAAQLQDTIRQTVLQVRTAFTHMIFAKQSLELSRAQLADFRHEVEIAQDRYKAGDLGRLDFERLDLQLGAFESDSANDEIALQQASDQLQTLIGVVEPTRTFDIAGDIVPPVINETREQLLQQALASRPDLRAALAGVQTAQSAYRLAIADGTADPTLEAEYDRTPQQPGYNSNSAGFNVNIPLRIFDRNQGNKETARLAIDQAQLTAVAARNQVASDVDQAWVAYTQAKILSDRYGNHYLDESADVLSIARFAFDHGGLALIDYLDSLRDSRTSVSNALNAYQQTWIAIHQLSESSTVELIP